MNQNTIKINKYAKRLFGNKTLKAKLKNNNKNMLIVVNNFQSATGMYCH